MDKDAAGFEQGEFHNARTCKICSIGTQGSLHSDLSDLSENNPSHRNSSPVSPTHYELGNGLESIDVIYTALGPDEFIGFCKGNILKYLHRANRKAFDEDLKKAATYAKWMFEVIDGKPPTH